MTVTARTRFEAQPPRMPHGKALHEFVVHIVETYDLTAEEELRLLSSIDGIVNIVALNALHARKPTKGKAFVPFVEDGPELMRPQEVSRALGIPESTLSNMRKNGRGPAWKQEGRAIYYRRADVRAYLADHVPIVKTEPAPPRDSLGPLNGSNNEDPSEARHD